MALAERLRISPGVPLLLAAFVWLASPLLLGAILSAAVCHELGHWLVLRRVGGRIQRLHITVFGAEMQVDDRRISYGGELLAAAAGPVSNLLLAAALAWLFAESVLQDRPIPALTKALRTALPLAVLAGVCYNFCVYFAAEPQLMGQNPALYENVSRLVQFWL